MSLLNDFVKAVGSENSKVTLVPPMPNTHYKASHSSLFLFVEKAKDSPMLSSLKTTLETPNATTDVNAFLMQQEADTAILLEDALNARKLEQLNTLQNALREKGIFTKITAGGDDIDNELLYLENLTAIERTRIRPLLRELNDLNFSVEFSRTGPHGKLQATKESSAVAMTMAGIYAEVVKSLQSVGVNVGVNETISRDMSQIVTPEAREASASFGRDRHTEQSLVERRSV